MQNKDRRYTPWGTPELLGQKMRLLSDSSASVDGVCQVFGISDYGRGTLPEYNRILPEYVDINN